MARAIVDAITELAEQQRALDRKHRRYELGLLLLSALAIVIALVK